MVLLLSIGAPGGAYAISCGVASVGVNPGGGSSWPITFDTTDKTVDKKKNRQCFIFVFVLKPC